MRLILVCLILSTNVFAGELSTFDFYKKSLSLLSSDLEKIENLNKEKSSDELKAAIDDMSILKKYFALLSSPLKLDLLLSTAQANGWMNVLRKTKELSNSCEQTDVIIELCKTNTEELLSFSQSSNLSVGNKVFIKKFLTSYIVQINALEVINPAFIQKFNNDIDGANRELNSRLNPVKAEASPSLKIAPTPDAVSISTKKLRYSEYIIFASILCMIFFMILIFKNFSSKKIIKNFYAKLFTVAKKNNVHLRIFGHLPISQVNFLKIFQTPILNTIYLSRSVSNKAQINFKKKDKSISFEIHYDTSRSIQQVIGLEKEKAFEESLKVLQDMTKMNSGEFLYMNHFNSFGDIVRSGVIINLPN
jgi:hypothetical protein